MRNQTIIKQKFLWGAATSAHQVEGAYLEEGKTLNIWDVVDKEKIERGENAKIACDHYHRFKEDVGLMKEIGLNSYRFSISWARIVPNVDGKINEKGLLFYVDLVNELLKVGIEPICTLYHWDMPMWLYNLGGWRNPDVVKYFADYVKIIVEVLSGKVRYWITLNEPQCFIGCGYVEAKQAPFERVNDYELGVITKNVMLAHACAVKTIRRYAKGVSYVGFAPTASLTMPTPDGSVSEKQAYEFTFDIKNGRYYNAAWWSDPMVLGKIPTGMDFLSDDDVKEICQPLDFYAYNIYSAENFSYKQNNGNLWFKGFPVTAMGWGIAPESMYWAAKFFYKRYRLPVLCSENGMANIDFVMSDGCVHDPQRVDFIRTYLIAMFKAVDDGVPVIGYEYWSLMDNYEWTHGYRPRFGLIYIDYRTQQRILKDSAYYYRDIIKSNGKILKL